MSRVIAGRGTPETVWRAWPLLSRLPALALAPPPARVVVVAPHPDDEVLGAGGLVALLARRGADVVVVALTDGEASHAGADAGLLARRRAAETDEALRRLLDRRAEVRRLRLPDGRLAEHEEVLIAGIDEALEPGAWCLATYRFDGHPDHEAAARAAGAACALRGARLYEYPIWFWHWCRPDASPAWAAARRIDLPAGLVARKRRAIAAFASQLRPHERAAGAVLPAHVLARFERPFEVVFT